MLLMDVHYLHSVGLTDWNVTELSLVVRSSSFHAKLFSVRFVSRLGSWATYPAEAARYKKTISQLNFAAGPCRLTPRHGCTVTGEASALDTLAMPADEAQVMPQSRQC